jgi:hypothetical protein
MKSSLRGGKPIPMPRGEVGRVVAKLVRRFPVCNPGKATPPPDYQEMCAVTKPVGYRGRPVYVCLVPRAAGSWLTKDDLVLGGDYSRRRGLVQLFVNRDQCAAPKRWAQEMRSTLRHELTHAADPYVTHRKTKYAAVTKKTPRVQHALIPETACGYYLDPVEITARIAQVEEELLRSDARREIRRDVRSGILKRGNLQNVLFESPTYVNIAPCLEKSPKAQRRFYQLAARMWAAGTFGPPPRRSFS